MIFNSGYAESYKVEGLDPLQAYKYRLKVSTSDGDVTLSPSITVCTTGELDLVYFVDVYIYI